MNCHSCGLPMMIDADHGGGKVDNPYCRYCTDEAGNLKPKEEIREGMINLYMQSFGKLREEAEKEVDTRMAQMSAWSVVLPVEPVEPVAPVSVQPITPEPVMSVPSVEPVPAPIPSQPVNLNPVPPVAVPTMPVQPVAPQENPDGTQTA